MRAFLNISADSSPIVIDLVVGMPVEHRPHVLSRVVCLLEPDRARVLEILLIFLRELSKFSAQTLMHQHNLAIVFAPNILRSGTDNPGQVITDAKATLEIVNLLLTDSSITSQRMEEVQRAPQSLKNSTKFKKTMQENYQAIRKDSTRKLEQASRKSRVSLSEFNKKMELLSQRIIEGELDPAMFDEAALKFMDPQLVAQFGGPDQTQFMGQRANRQQRNANRNVTIMIDPSVNSPPSMTTTAPTPSITLSANASRITSMESASTGSEGGSSFTPRSPRTEDDPPTSSHIETSSNGTSDTSDTHSAIITAPGSGELVSPRTIARTKPSLQRASSASSGNTIEVGLQRSRSNHLSSISVNAVALNSAKPTSPLSSSQPGSPVLSVASGTPFSLGTHRPKEFSNPTSTSTNANASAPVPHTEWHRSAARHRQSDPMAGMVPTKDLSSVPSVSPSSSTIALVSTSNPVSNDTVTSSVSDPQIPVFSDSAVATEDEDLDHIMGDLLSPFQVKSSPREATHSESPHSSRTPRTHVTTAPLAALSSSSSMAESSSSEAATIVTLELLELMLGQSELPEIVVPIDEPDDASPSETSDTESNGAHTGSVEDSHTQQPQDAGALSDEEVEVETATLPLFPTTGLFSSPLIMSPASNRHQNLRLEEDPSMPTLGDIHALLAESQEGI